MKRDIYSEDHEDFRAAVRTWLERDVIPNTDKHIADKALPREFWLKAGENGFLGLSLDELFETGSELTTDRGATRAARRSRVDDVIADATRALESLPASVRLEALAQVQLQVMKGMTD